MIKRDLTFQQKFTIRCHLRENIPDSYGQKNLDAALWAGEVFWRTDLCLGNHPLMEDLVPIIQDWFNGIGPSTVESEFTKTDRIAERCGYGVN